MTAQSARGATRDEALRQCIDFELMAIEADKVRLYLTESFTFRVLETKAAVAIRRT